MIDPFNCPDCGRHDFGLFHCLCPDCTPKKLASLGEEVDKLRDQNDLAYAEVLKLRTALRDLIFEIGSPVYMHSRNKYGEYQIAPEAIEEAYKAAGLLKDSPHYDSIWRFTPMPEDWTCGCGIYVHPTRLNAEAIHCSGCPYGK